MRQLEIPYWRPHDYISPRGARYWFHPEWVRDLGGCVSKIYPQKKGDASSDAVSFVLCGESLVGSTYGPIAGPVQERFQEWYKNREIDCILMGEDMRNMLTVNRDNNEIV